MLNSYNFGKTSIHYSEASNSVNIFTVSTVFYIHVSIYENNDGVFLQVSVSSYK